MCRADVIHPNNPAGDSFTNASSSNQGQAIGASGWYYNNVRNNGVVGIDGTYPQSATGSVFFNSPSGSGKADIEYLANGTSVSGNYYANGSLGSFSSLSGASYDWYRDSGSTTTGNFHPAFRILLDADGNLATLGDRGGLVFERSYNTPSTVPTDTWVTDLIGNSTNLWNFGLGISNASNINGTAYAYDGTLAQWQTYFPNAVILGFSSGVGSGWNGTFSGGVDNIGWTIGGQTTTNNFEVPAAQAIPEPATLALLGGFLLTVGVGRMRRRTTAAV